MMTKIEYKLTFPLESTPVRLIFVKNLSLGGLSG